MIQGYLCNSYPVSLSHQGLQTNQKIKITTSKLYKEEWLTPRACVLFYLQRLLGTWLCKYLILPLSGHFFSYYMVSRNNWPWDQSSQGLHFEMNYNCHCPEHLSSPSFPLPPMICPDSSSPPLASHPQTGVTAMTPPQPSSPHLLLPNLFFFSLLQPFGWLAPTTTFSLPVFELLIWPKKHHPFM